MQDRLNHFTKKVTMTKNALFYLTLPCIKNSVKSLSNHKNLLFEEPKFLPFGVPSWFCMKRKLICVAAHFISANLVNGIEISRMEFLHILGQFFWLKCVLVKKGNSNLGSWTGYKQSNFPSLCLLLTSKNKNLLFYLAGRQITHEQSLLKGCVVSLKSSNGKRAEQSRYP